MALYKCVAAKILFYEILIYYDQYFIIKITKICFFV